MIPEERRRKITRLVREAGSVTVALLEAEFGISPMTARRDLVALEEEGRVRRTHGGAGLSEDAGHGGSVWDRLGGAGGRMGEDTAGTQFPPKLGWPSLP